MSLCEVINNSFRNLRCHAYEYEMAKKCFRKNAEEKCVLKQKHKKTCGTEGVDCARLCS